MMEATDLRIHGYAEFKKAIGHLDAAMEYIHWLNYYGAPEKDQEHEKKISLAVAGFIDELMELIG